MNRLVCISDTHLYENEINIPDGDILIHAGDFLSSGSMNEFGRFARNIGKIAKRFKHVVMTPGNHDWAVYKEENICKTILKENSKNIHLLIDEKIILDELKFYGSPRTIEFFYWAFMYPKGSGNKYWNNIPSDVDVLITHQPPLNKLDYVIRPNADGNHNVGCEELLKKVLEIRPLLHVYGHLHEDGCKYIKGVNTLYVNAAMCDESYIINRKPIVVEIDKINKTTSVITGE